MELTIGNKNLKFIPNSVSSFDDIVKYECVMTNDIYEKYNASAQVSGQLIICNDADKLKIYGKVINRETYEQYLEFLKNYDSSRDLWIYNIIDGIDEQDKIIYQDALCITIPTYKWCENDVRKLHILCIPKDKNLRCIRDLRGSHIELLEHMKNVTIDTIKLKYDLDHTNLKMFFHYDPSTYHLHIHFANIDFCECMSSVEYSHELNNVIFNLNIDSDYYRKVILNKRN